MTRRDYVMLSTALRSAARRASELPSGVGGGEAFNREVGVKMAAQEIGRAIASSNAAFDQPRFIRDAECE